MADTYTTNLNLTKPEPGAAEDTWGISLNSDLDTLDAIFSSSGTQVNLNPNQVNFADNKKAIFGTGSDLQIYHNATDSYIENATGNLEIRNNANDGDINFRSDNGSGGLTTYFAIDGGDVVNRFYKDAYFTDNVKAKFGSSSDLQIYHDGGNSRILDNGTGFLAIGTNGSDIRLTGNSFNEYMAKFVQDGAVELYHNGLKKFETTSTGIDVTGTVTSDGIDLEENTSMYSQDATLSYYGSNNAVYLNGAGNNGWLRLNASGASNDSNAINIFGANVGIGITFKTASSERARIDANGNLLVGTTSYNNDNAGIGLGASNFFYATRDGNLVGSFNRLTSDGTIIDFRKDSATVGSIGSDSGTIYIDGGSGSTGLYFGSSNIYPRDNGSTVNNAVDIGHGSYKFRNLYLSNSAYVKNIGGTTDTDTYINFGDVANVMKFFTGGSERARIDTSGNLLVGKTSGDFGATVGVEIRGTGNSYFTANNGNALRLNRTGTDGEILTLRKDNGTVGFLRSYAGTRLSIGSNGASGVIFGGTDILPATSGTTPVNNTYNLGSASYKFKDLHLSGTANVGGISANSGTTDLVATFQSSDQFADIKLQDSGGSSFIRQSNGSLIFEADRDNAVSSSALVFQIDGSNVGRFTSNGRLGIGTTAPNNKLTVSGASDGINIVGTNSFVRWNSGNMMIRDEGSFAMGFHTYDGSTGQVERMRITSAGNIGIGTTTPNYLLDVEGTGSLFRINSTSGAAALQISVPDTTSLNDINFGDSGSTTSGQIRYRHTGDSMAFSTGGSERARIDSIGRLGIGTSSPSTGMHLSFGDSKAELTLERTGTNASSWGLKPYNGDFFIRESGTDRVTVKAGGNVGIGTTSPTETLHVMSGVSNDTVAIISGSQADRGLTISTYASDGRTDGGVDFDAYKSFKFTTDGSERVRIDSSGNLLVGTTSAANSSAGFRAYSGGNGAFTIAGTTLSLNRLSSDGEILNFQKNTSTVGSISTVAGYLGLASGDTGLLFRSPYDDILPYSSTANSAINNTIDLGDPSFGFKDLYLKGKAQADTYQFAQNSSAVGVTDAIYRATTSTIAFKTGSSERMRLNTTGLGIGTSSPSTALTVVGDITVSKTAAGSNILSLQRNGATNPWKLAQGHTATDYFEILEGNDARLTIKNGGRVGIGTSSPGYLLSLSDSNGADLHFSNSSTLSDGDYLGRIYAADSTNNFFAGINMFYHDSNDGEMRFRIKTSGTNTDVMTLVDGRAGIGTTSPSHKLTVEGTTSHTTARVKTTTGNANLRVSTNNSDFAIIGQGGSNRLDVYDNNGSSTRLSLDSNGNFLVGKTSTSYAVEGISLRADNNGVMSTTTNKYSFVANRLSSDGDLILFAKDTATVGRISTTGGDLLIGTGDCGIRFSDGGDQIRVCTDTGTNRDGVIDLGYTDSRFKDLHLSGKVFVPEIETSGNFTIDASGDIELNADGGDITFVDGSTEFGRVFNSSSNFYIQSRQSDKDMIFQGVDGGSTITALTLDMSVGGQLKAAPLGVSTPTYAFSNDSNTGMTRPTSDTLQFVTAGSEKVRITEAGRLGIGESSPDCLVHIKEGTKDNTVLKLENYLATVNGATYANYQELLFAAGGSGPYSSIRQYANGWANSDTALAFWTQQHGGSYAERMRIDGDGNVGINTPSPAEKLTVSGNQNITGKLSVGAAAAHGSYDFYNQNTAYFNGTVYVDDTLAVTSGYVGIGVTSPAVSIHAQSSTAEASRSLRLAYDGSYYFDLRQKGAGGIVYNAVNASSGGHRWQLDGSEKARITYDGKFYVGTTTGQTTNSHITTKAAVSGDVYLNGVRFNTNTSEATQSVSSSKLWMDSTDLYIGSTLIETGATSDIRLKENIENIPNAIEKVKLLNGVTFNYKKKPDVKEAGFIAQDVQKALPEAVYTAYEDDEEVLALRYNRITSVLVEAIKEQQEQIESLKSEIANLKGE